MGLEAARRAQCANNLRQLYLATKLYEEQFGAPPFHPKHHFLAWNPNLAPLLICPSDPYKGYRHKHMVKPEFFVPESYDFIYWGAYHVVRTPPERRRRGPKELWERVLKNYWRELTSPDGHWIVCYWHELTVFPDGRVGKATRFIRPRPEDIYRGP